MTLTSTATEPTVYGLGGAGGIPSQSNIVLTYPAAASQTILAGDWIKLISTTAGTVGVCTATSDSPIGVAETSVDNSAGAAGDKYVPVVRQGVVYCDVAVNASGNSGKIVNFDDGMYLAGTLNARGATAVAQVLTASSTDNGTTIIARALDSIALPTTSAIFKMRVYLDRMSKSVVVV